MDIPSLVVIIPVILAAALIIHIVRRNITGRRPGDPIHIADAIPAFVILTVAVVLIGGMANSASPYFWDEDSGELTINQNVGVGSQKWDSLGADVKSLIINDHVNSVADGSFDTLTALKYISIASSVNIKSSAFGVTLKNYLNQVITNPVAGEYAGAGDGTLYLVDESLYTYDTDGTTITGLASSVSSTAKSLAIPSEHNGAEIIGIDDMAFSETGIKALIMSDKTKGMTLSPGVASRCASLSVVSIDHVVAIPNAAFQYTALESVSLPSATYVGEYAFQHCESLTEAILPKVEILDTYALQNTALESVSLPSAKTIFNGCFRDCTALTEADLPLVTEIKNYAFFGCTALAAVSMPSITTIGDGVFQGCTGISSVSFGPLTTVGTTTPFPDWVFYASDGTTQIDKAVASNLANSTFTGTRAALVKSGA